MPTVSIEPPGRRVFQSTQAVPGGRAPRPCIRWRRGSHVADRVVARVVSGASCVLRKDPDTAAESRGVVPATVPDPSTTLDEVAVRIRSQGNGCWNPTVQRSHRASRRLQSDQIMHF
jgi:hypothetical protein